MGLCNIGGKDGYLRKMISDKLNYLGVTVAKAYDSAATFVSNIQMAVNNADAAGYTRGSSDAKQGTATEGQVLTGYTFTNQNGLYSGSMPNRGALNWNPTTSTTYSVPAGYYSGGTLNSSNAYTSGVTAGKQSMGSNTVGTNKFHKVGTGTSYTTTSEGLYLGICLYGEDNSFHGEIVFYKAGTNVTLDFGRVDKTYSDGGGGAANFVARAACLLEYCASGVSISCNRNATWYKVY